MFEGFNNLPLLVQYAMAIGGALGGAALVIWRLVNLKASPPPTDTEIAQQLVIRAAELDNQSLRNEMIEVVRISRESIQQRIDQAFAQMSARIEQVERRLNQMETAFERLRTRRH